MYKITLVGSDVKMQIWYITKNNCKKSTEKSHQMVEANKRHQRHRLLDNYVHQVKQLKIKHCKPKNPNHEFSSIARSEPYLDSIVALQNHIPPTNLIKLESAILEENE